MQGGGAEEEESGGGAPGEGGGARTWPEAPGSTGVPHVCPQVSNDRSTPLLSAEDWRPLARPPNPTNRQAARSLHGWQEGPKAPKQADKQVSSSPNLNTHPSRPGVGAAGRLAGLAATPGDMDCSLPPLPQAGDPSGEICLTSPPTKGPRGLLQGWRQANQVNMLNHGAECTKLH